MEINWHPHNSEEERFITQTNSNPRTMSSFEYKHNYLPLNNAGVSKHGKENLRFTSKTTKQESICYHQWQDPVSVAYLIGIEPLFMTDPELELLLVLRNVR